MRVWGWTREGDEKHEENTSRGITHIPASLYIIVEIPSPRFLWLFRDPKGLQLLCPECSEGTTKRPLDECI